MRGVCGRAPEVGYPSSSTSGRAAGCGGVGGGDCEVGLRRCLRIGGGAASSSLEDEGERAGCGGEEGGCLEFR